MITDFNNKIQRPYNSQGVSEFDGKLASDETFPILNNNAIKKQAQSTVLAIKRKKNFIKSPTHYQLLLN